MPVVVGRRYAREGPVEVVSGEEEATLDNSPSLSSFKGLTILCVTNNSGDDAYWSQRRKGAGGGGTTIYRMSSFHPYS